MTEQNKQEPKMWVLYGDWHEHPNGYPIKKLLQIGIESGPDLQKDEKVTVVERSALEKAQAKLIEKNKAYTDLLNEYTAYAELKNKEIEKLNAKCSMLEATLKGHLRTIHENMKLKEKCDELLLWLDIGECFCISCRKLVLEKHQDKKEGDS